MNTVLLTLGVVLIVAGIALVDGWLGAGIAFIGGVCLGVYEQSRD